MNLSNLPPDIVKSIMSIDEELLDKGRLISPTWNNSILEYLQERRYEFPLQEVILSTGKVYEYDDSEARKEAEEKVTMRVVMPGRHSYRVGMGQWLQYISNVNSKAVNAMNIPYRFEISNDENGKEIGHNFRRFFSMCSCIDRLALDGFPDWRVLEAVMTTMGEIHVKKLQLNDIHAREGNITNVIMESIRRNAIKHVAIDVSALASANRFLTNEFICEVIKANCTLDVYATYSKYSQRNRDLWDEKATQLGKEGISLQFLEKGDPSFDVRLTEFQCVRAHVGVMSMEQRKSGIDRIIINERLRNYLN